LSGLEKGLNAFFGGLILIAIFAVLVKPGAQTPQVLSSGGTAVATSLYGAEGIK